METPRELGRYRVLRQVGAGGFGSVYQAHDSLLDRPVAIKVLHGSDHDEDDSHRQSVAEARAASALSHPGIVTIHDVGRHEGRSFIVMEWVEGTTLRSRMRAGIPMPPAQISEAVTQIAAALTRAHEAGIIHRDLKPENVMIRPDGVAKILDFGIARRASDSPEPSAARTRTTAMDATTSALPDVLLPEDTAAKTSSLWELVGTPRYMSPEQVLGAPLTTASDLFALGIILFELATGRHPFEDTHAEAIMRRILYEDPPPPETIAPIPAGWSQMILELLARDPARRPSSALEVVHLVGHARLAAGSESSKAPAVEPVGRMAESEALAEAWSGTRTGRSGIVLCEGEAGIGKTSLIEAFIDSLHDDRDVLVGRSRCTDRIGPGEAYLPFLELLSDLCGSAQGGLIRSVLRGKAPTWYLHLFPDAAAATDLQRAVLGAGQDRMRRELIDAFEEIGRSFSLCLFIDDLQWADGASVEMLARIAGHLSSLRVLLVGAVRPFELRAGNPELDRILNDLSARRTVTRIGLQLLSIADVLQLVERRFPAHAFPTGFTDWLHRKSGGNPLFVLDLLQVIAEKRLVANEGTWRLTSSLDDLEQAMPASGRDLIARGLERLSEDEIRLLSIAAVSGDVFDTLCVAEVAGEDPIDVEEAFERISRLHGLTRWSGEHRLLDQTASVRCAFVHSLYQSHLYDRLTPGRRAQYHLRTAEHIETHLGPDARLAAPRLARHFALGRDPERAIRFCLLAAHGEMAKFAAPQAAAFCEQAFEQLDLLPAAVRIEREPGVLDMRGRIHAAMGRFQEATADFAAVAHHAATLGDASAEAEALGHSVMPLLLSKRTERLRRDADRLVEIAKQARLPVALLHGHMAYSALHGVIGEVDQSSEHMQRALALARDLGDPGTIGNCLNEYAGLHLWRGEYETALELEIKALPLILQGGDAQSLINAYWSEGMTLGNLGRMDLALVALEEGMRLARVNDERFWLTRFPNTIGFIHYEAFDFPRSLELNREGIALCRELELLEPEANSQINVGLVALALSDLDLARKCFETADAIFARDDFFRWRYRQRLELGWADYQLRLGRYDDAERHARQCAELAVRSAGGRYVPLAHCQLGRIAVQAGRLDRAEGHLRAASVEAGRTDSVLVAWRLHHAWAEFHRARKDPAQAGEHERCVRRVLTTMAAESPPDLRQSILDCEVLRSLPEVV